FLGTDERAATLAEQLDIRGFVVGSADDTDADIAIASADTTRADFAEDGGAATAGEGDLNQTISYDVPADARTLLARHGGDPDAIVMVTPRELPHLREIARQGD